MILVIVTRKIGPIEVVDIQRVDLRSNIILIIILTDIPVVIIITGTIEIMAIAVNITRNIENNTIEFSNINAHGKF